MFTGIIETTGTILSAEQEGKNKRFTIASSIATELKADQSVAHDGVCLTVVQVQEGCHEVVAVRETLKRTNLIDKKPGDELNLERCLMMNARLDGHLVQGHVDDVADVKRIKEEKGSWEIRFTMKKKHSRLLVDKGSVCINGVSLTVIKPSSKSFSVAIIPYTFEHTNLKKLKEGDRVNIEFDIIGKYISRQMKRRT